MKAAVFHAAHQPLEIEDVQIDEPRGREVLVRLVASGVCGSDLHSMHRERPGAEPMVMGHEGAGIVERVGPDVSYVQPGDRVIACLSIFCGECERCLIGRPNICLNRPARAPDEPPRITRGGEPLGQQAGLGTHAEYMLAHENALVQVDPEISLQSAVLVSCGVTTGVGAVFNTAQVRPGSTVAVFGAGGVGLSAVQGARIAGASMIINVDLVPEKLERALSLGATHAVNASEQDPVEAIREISGGGVDYSFEVIGAKQTAEQAFACIRPGGTTIIIGIFPTEQTFEIAGAKMNHLEWTLKRSSMGSNRFRVDMPKYLELYKQGRLKLDEMISRTGPLEEINDFFRAMDAGEVARTVITFDGAE